jgi:uncharacterized protein YkwD
VLVRAIAAPAVALCTAAGCGLPELDTTDLGDASRCAEVSVWPSSSAEEEVALAEAVLDLRGRGTACGEDDVAGVGPLEVVPELRCAARQLAGDLARRDDLDHEGSDGSTTLSRVNLSGYTGITRHEMLAVDFTTADDTLAALAADPQHCGFLMDKTLDHMGVGQAESTEGDRIVWVVVTGEERE